MLLVNEDGVTQRARETGGHSRFLAGPHLEQQGAARVRAAIIPVFRRNSPSEDFATTTLLAPEALVRYTFIDGRVAPYAGGGGGFVMRHTGGETVFDPSTTGAAGVRFRLTEETSLQGEMRLRGIGRTWAGSNAEWTAGLVWRPSGF